MQATTNNICCRLFFEIVGKNKNTKMLVLETKNDIVVDTKSVAQASFILLTLLLLFFLVRMQLLKQLN